LNIDTLIIDTLIIDYFFEMPQD